MKRIAGVVLAGTLLVPLIALPGFLPMPYVTAKVFFFRIIVMVALALFGVVWLQGKRSGRVRFTPIELAVLLWSSVLVLATLFGVDRARSFWANHERMMGVFTLLHYTLFFFLGARAWRGARWVERLISIFLISAVPVLVFAIVEHSPIPFLSQGSVRVVSTVGSAFSLSLYAAYILILSFARARFASTLLYRCLYGALAATALFVVFLTQTRGTILALILLGVCWLVRLVATRGKRGIVAAGVVIACIGAGLFLVMTRPALRTAVSGLPIVHRFLDSATRAGGVGTRFAAWRAAYAGFRARPILGWGPFNYFYVFNTYYDPALIQYGLQETWFDSAHNMFLEVLATGGTLGFLSYSALFVVPLVLLFRQKNKSPFRSVLASLLLVHAVYNFFEIEDPTTYFLFIFLLIFINESTRAPEAVEKETAPARGNSRAVLATLVCLALGIFVYYTNAIPAYAASLAERGDQARVERGDATEWFLSYQHALSLPTPHKESLRLALASNLVRMQIPEEQRADPLVKEAFSFTLSELERSARAHPRDPFFLTLAGDTLVIEGALDQAIVAYKKALEVAPRRQQIYFVMADALLMAGRFDEARESATYARDLAPEYLKTQQLYRAFLEKYENRTSK